MMLVAALRKLARIPARRLALAAEAMLWLGVARLLITILPLCRITPLIGLRAANPHDAVAEIAGSASHIGWAIGAAARRTPWRSTCLVQALGGAIALRLRGIPAMLVLGVARNPHAGQTLAAHAWLSSAGDMLTGGPEASGFRPVAWFAREGRR